MGENGDKTVPYERFAEVVAERNSLREKLAQAELEKQTWEKERAALTGALEAAKAEAAKVVEFRAREQLYAELAPLGLAHPEFVEALQWSHSRLPEKGRPEMHEWAKQLVSDPAKAPLVLRPHLEAAQQRVAKQQAQGQQGQGQAPQQVQGQPGHGAPQGQPQGTMGEGFQPQQQPQGGAPVFWAVPAGLPAGTRPAPALPDAATIGQMSAAEYEQHRASILGAIGIPVESKTG